MGTPTIEDNVTDKGAAAATGPYTATITGLTAGETYYVRAYAVNTIGTVYGEEVSFTALNPTEVTTQAVSDVSTNTVTGSGTIVEPGSPAPSQHGFCWNTTGTPTVDDSTTDEGPVDFSGAFSGEVSGLTPGTTYYLRAYALSESGAFYGEEITFTTIDADLAPRAVLSEGPASPTNQTGISVQVGGLGVVAYRYRLDGGALSQERPVTEKIEEDVYGEELHRLGVIGRDSAGIWQAVEEVTTLIWVLDTTAPEAVLNNTPAGIIGPAAVSVTVGGRGVATYKYSLDQEAWSFARPIDRTIDLPELVAGEHSLFVVGMDRAGNWQTEDAATFVTWEVDAQVPTAVLTQLPEAVTRETDVAISVTASAAGVPIEEYTYLLDYNYQFWQYEENSKMPIEIPKLSEGEHTVCVNAFGNGLWQDGEDGYASIDNATCYTWRVDLTAADAAVLTAENTNPDGPGQQALTDSKAVRLAWSWSSTDEEEAIQRYRIWYSGTEITESNLENAVEVFCDLVPGPAGFEEQFVINGLVPGETYYFAVQSTDLAGNASPLSSPAVVTTRDVIPEIDSLSLDVEGLTVDNGASAQLTIEGSHFVPGSDTNQIRLEDEDNVLAFYGYAETKTGLSALIPLGTPTGIYRVRVINKHGVSISSAQRVTLVDAEIALPSVRSVSPSIAAIGSPTLITIKGNHFSETLLDVNLVGADGSAAPLDTFTWVDADTLTALIDVSEDFPEGRYDIQVVNTETEYNEISAAKIELYRPIDLGTAAGAQATSRIVGIDNGLVPVLTRLFSDTQGSTGLAAEDRISVQVMVDPGTVFESSVQGEWTPYTGPVLPPRPTVLDGSVSESLGSEAVAFSMGASMPLRLADNATLFVTLKVILPSAVTDPVVYYTEEDGALTPAGVDGQWQGIAIETGGTVLDRHVNLPQTGVTTFTLGVMMDHLSGYAIGPSSLSNSNPNGGGSMPSSDYGPCFVGSAKYTSGSPSINWPGFLLVLLVMHALRKRFKKRHFRLFLFLCTLIVTLHLGTLSIHAAEGAAVKGTDSQTPPSGGIAIPDETQPVPQLQEKKQKKTFIPAAASSTATPQQKEARGEDFTRWKIHAGAGYAYIGKTYETTENGVSFKHQLDSDLYPLVGTSFAVTRRFSLELSLRRDFFSGSSSGAQSDGSSTLEGLTTQLGSLFFWGPYGKNWRPYGLAGIGYRILQGDLNYPVTSYAPAFGPVLGVGVLKGNLDMRLGYSYFMHDPDSTQSGYNASGDELETSGIFIEIGYHFLSF